MEKSDHPMRFEFIPEKAGLIQSSCRPEKDSIFTRCLIIFYQGLMRPLTNLSHNQHESAYVCLPRNNNLIIDDLVKSSADGLGALTDERTEPADIRRGIHRGNGSGARSHRRIVMLELG